jgi:hypothetical protein|tara:strand:- start:882 stop:1727 length:846 start_codon:yes stop_codon:yes gene_type:complete
VRHHDLIRIQIENRLYERLVLEAVEYAILSLPYTINRMELKETSTRIVNIAKGKLSETLFIHFCRANEIPLRIDTCQTPFYQPDRRDFILGREEWDLKNNFLHHQGPVLLPDDYYELPGLIPDRGQWDQWSKRSDCLHQPETEAVCFLFSFMKGWQGKQPFLTVSFTPEQHAFLDEMIARVGQESEPYDPDWFWSELRTRGGGKRFNQRLFMHPELIICGFAGPGELDRFQELKPQTFGSGAMRTRIQNRGLAVQYLPSFLNLYPRLKESMTWGTILGQGF